MSDRRKREREENEQAGFIERHDADQETISGFDRHTVEIELHCKAMFEAAKAVHKYGEKVQKKQMKSKSKHLEKYKTKYTENLEAFETEKSFIDNILNKTKKRKIERSTSVIEKQRSVNCTQCEFKDREINTLKLKLESIKQGHSSNREVHLQYEREIATLKEHLRQETKAKEDNTIQLSTMVKTHKDVVDNLEQEIAVLKKENHDVRQQCMIEKDGKDEALQRLGHVASSNKQSHGSNREVHLKYEREIATLKEHLRKEVTAKENCTQQLTTMMNTHKDVVVNLEQEIAVLKKENHDVRQQCRIEKDGKDEALQRLSHVASSKLRDNNPNITDLSDQNRPTKIAEKMSELYDNQWTDAFDALEKKYTSDLEIISALLASLMTAYKECYKLANDNFFETVQSAIECPRKAFKPSPLKLGMSQQLMKEIKEFRKLQALKVVDEIKAMILPRLRLHEYRSADIDSYLSMCIEIGWLMVVQDPPLELLEEAPDRFDTTTFKDYTRRGRYTEFVVWPALLLHKNGPLLAKGVAQGSDHSFKSQSLGRKQKIEKRNEAQMVSTYTARRGNKRPAIQGSTFRSPVYEDSDKVTHI